MDRNKTVLLAHGSGGSYSRRLTEEVFAKAFDNPLLAPLNDQAVFTLPAKKLAFTTDSYVVKPIFFPGGDIGKLSVCGTINDLAVGGAEPMYLSASFIIEEGYSIKALEKIEASETLPLMGALSPIFTLVSQGSLFVTKSETLRSHQLLGGALGDSILNLKLRAVNEPGWRRTLVEIDREKFERILLLQPLARVLAEPLSNIFADWDEIFLLVSACRHAVRTIYFSAFGGASACSL